MTAVYIEDTGDAEDRAYGSYKQDLVDAFFEGKAAGLREERFDCNPYLRIDAMHEQWNLGWREGIAQAITKDRRAA